jgi:hypothetical protein
MLTYKEHIEMKMYVAKGAKHSTSGQLFYCLAWAQSEIEQDEEVIVHIMRVRVGETHGRLIAEVTEEGTRYLDGCRLIKSARLLKGV